MVCVGGTDHRNVHVVIAVPRFCSSTLAPNALPESQSRRYTTRHRTPVGGAVVVVDDVDVEVVDEDGYVVDVVGGTNVVVQLTPFN